MDVCTIIAKNYLAFARVLGDSLRELHPEVRFHVLVIDEAEDYFDAAAEPFEVLGPDQLAIPSFGRMAGMYDVLELSTAVKPWLLRHVLEASGGDGAVYLDPDMRLFGRIDEVFDAVREHGLVLNPHNVDPMPRDGKKPDDQDILIAGAYNLGFIGLGGTDSTESFLDWWSERLERDCVVDPEHGLFVDQRWIDLVPGMAADFALVRDPGFNVAYWNLATRTLSREDGGYRVNGVPLRLFHFSGFDPLTPHLLSKHQDRIRLADEPIVAELCRDYADALITAGHELASQWPYSYAETISGIPLDRRLRATIRDAAEAGIDASPFDRAGESQLIDWCNGPAERGGQAGVTRYMEKIYESRDDLQAEFPKLDERSDAKGFVAWTAMWGSSELPIAPELLPFAPAGAGDAPAPDDDRPSLAVNVAGYLHSELGVGRAARQIVASLDAYDVSSFSIGLETPLSQSERTGAAQGHIDAPFDINIICVNADHLPGFAQRAGPDFFSGRHSIGVWWWELSEFPEEWHESFSYLDEVWIGSRFVADAVAVASPIPVMSFPLPVAEPRVLPPDRAALGLPEDRFVFLFAFDYNSVFNRKNPVGAIEAFTRAFGPGDGAHLVVKSMNHEHDPDNHDLLRMAAEPHPHVQLISEYLPRDQNDRLIASCDAYVSLHRSEGFGLGMAEALLHEKPVVATAYGGNTDFITEATGYPIGYSMVEVGPGAYPYPASARWAEPDLDDAARAMERVVAQPEEAAERARQGAQLVRSRHTAEAAGERFVARLSAIHQRRLQGPAGRQLRWAKSPQRWKRGVARVQGRLGRASSAHAPGRVLRRLANLPAKGRETGAGGTPRQRASTVDQVRDAAAVIQAENQAEFRRLNAELNAARSRLRQLEESVRSSRRDSDS